MRNKFVFLHIALFLALVFAATEASAQAHPERKNIRNGNRDYESLNYGAAEGDYRSALMKNPASYEAGINLGDALYKQERYEEAEGLFELLAQNPFLTPEQRAKVLYNLGNTQFQQQKLEDALGSYGNSIINNPSDLEAKYNYAYTEKLLQENGGGEGDGEGDENQDGDGEQNPEGGDDEEGGENQNSEQDNNDGESEQDNTPEYEPNISVEDAEQMLQAIQAQEDKTQEKLEEQKQITVAPSGKNW